MIQQMTMNEIVKGTIAVDLDDYSTIKVIGKNRALKTIRIRYISSGNECEITIADFNTRFKVTKVPKNVASEIDILVNMERKKRVDKKRAKARAKKKAKRKPGRPKSTTRTPEVVACCKQLMKLFPTWKEFDNRFVGKIERTNYIEVAVLPLSVNLSIHDEWADSFRDLLPEDCYEYKPNKILPHRWKFTAEQFVEVVNNSIMVDLEPENE